jgi:hypothetical protein
LTWGRRGTGKRWGDASLGHILWVGDRVRVTARNLQADYQPGEAGEVVAGPETLPGDRRRYYLVRISRWEHFATSVFAEGEIERDVTAGRGIDGEEVRP